MTTDKNYPVSPHQRVLKVAPQVHYGRPNPQLMRIHAMMFRELSPRENRRRNTAASWSDTAPCRFLTASRVLNTHFRQHNRHITADKH